MKKRNRLGFTLIEILISLLIITILVVAGSAFLYRASGIVIQQKHRRVAIEAASRRLEQLIAVPYSELRPGSSGTHYINRFNQVVSVEPEEEVPINGRNQSIVVTVERLQENSPAREFVRIKVKVRYISGDNWVSVVTNHG